MSKRYRGVKLARKSRKPRKTTPELRKHTAKGQFLNPANDHANPATPQTIKVYPAGFAGFRQTPEQQNPASVFPGHRPFAGVYGVCGVWFGPYKMCKALPHYEG